MTISFNNYAKKIESREVGGKTQDFFRWLIFVDASDDELEKIDSVEYELHPSITNPYRPVADRSSKFALKFNSWGSFGVRMTIVFKDGTKKQDRYQLNENKPFPDDVEGAPIPSGTFVLKTTSFFQKERQKEFWEKDPSLNGYKLYNIHAIIDSSVEGMLEKVERVEYFLPAHPPPLQIQVRTDYKDKFLLKELAHGAFWLTATVFLKGKKTPIELKKHIELQELGPRIE
jgi:hypothetical protein